MRSLLLFVVLAVSVSGLGCRGLSNSGIRVGVGFCREGSCVEASFGFHSAHAEPEASAEPGQ